MGSPLKFVYLLGLAGGLTLSIYPLVGSRSHAPRRSKVTFALLRTDVEPGPSSSPYRGQKILDGSGHTNWNVWDALDMIREPPVERDEYIGGRP